MVIEPTQDGAELALQPTDSTLELAPSPPGARAGVGSKSSAAVTLGWMLSSPNYHRRSCGYFHDTIPSINVAPRFGLAKRTLTVYQDRR
jgi:hypothetical protein